MESGAGEVIKDGFGFDPVQDGTVRSSTPQLKIRLDNRRTPTFVQRYTSPYIAPSSGDPSIHWDFPRPTDLQPDSYFPALADDSSWACPDEQLWCDLPDVSSTPNSVPDNTTFHPNQEYKDVSNHHADLAKITEYVKWDNPAPGTVEHQTSPREQHRSYSSTPSPQPYYSMPFRGTSRARSDSDGRKPLGRSDSDCHKPLGRSQPSSSSEGQSSQKRRRSLDGRSMIDPAVPVEENIDIVESNQSSKNAHSVIERRYRENLNAKITQLDQVLISTREHESFSPDEKPIEVTSKTRKADVLTDAIRYVKQMELESKARMQEISFLRLRVVALEKLMKCGDCALLKQYAGLQVM